MAAPLGPIRHIAIIGLGATGCALLPMVATLPFTIITLVDGDTIEPSNLPRQPLYGPDDHGRAKVEVALERTRHLHVHRSVLPVGRFMDANNVAQLLKGTDMVADCTDDPHARMLLDKACGEMKIPLVTAPIHDRQLQALTLHVAMAERQPLSLRSFFPGRNGPAQDGCEMRDVPVHVPQMAAALMMRRITELLSGDLRTALEMDVVDMRHGQWIKIAAPLPPEDDELIA